MSFKQQSKRASYVDVKKAQKNIIQKIDTLIDENRVLTDKERNNFLHNLLPDSTLGLGVEFSFFIRGKKEKYSLGHIEHGIRWIAYREFSSVKIGEEKIEIKELWKKTRDYLFIVFPYALTLSFKISQEQIKLGGSKPAEI